MLKLGLATQGLGAVVPNVEGLLPELAGDYLVAMTDMIKDNLDKKFTSVDQYLAEAADAGAVAKAMSSVEPFIRKGEGASADDKDWVSDKCGLSRMVSKKDKTVAWVSDDAMSKFNKEGKAAIASQLKS